MKKTLQPRLEHNSFKKQNQRIHGQSLIGCNEWFDLNLAQIFSLNLMGNIQMTFLDIFLLSNI